MAPFEYVGVDRRRDNVVRSLLLAVLFVLDAILLLPFLLLDLFLWSLGFLAGQFARRPVS